MRKAEAKILAPRARETHSAGRVFEFEKKRGDHVATRGGISGFWPLINLILNLINTFELYLASSSGICLPSYKVDHVFYHSSKALFSICPPPISKDIKLLIATTSFVVFSNVIYNIREGSKGLEISCILHNILQGCRPIR